MILSRLILWFVSCLKNRDSCILVAGSFSNFNLQCATLLMQSVLSLSDQLEMFNDYITKLEQIVGYERTSTLLSESLFIVVAGSNDITNTYFGMPVRKSQYDVSSYTDLLVSYASSFMQVKSGGIMHPIIQ